MPETPVIRLIPKADRRLKSGHPWIYANEIRMEPQTKALTAGTIARFEDANGALLAQGYFNPHSLIVGRILTRGGNDTEIDATFYQHRLTQALSLRTRCFESPYYRLVHAEADQLPGLVIDRYGDFLVMQFNSAGATRDRALIIEACQTLLRPRGIVAHQEGGARRLEGLVDEPPLLIGEAPETLSVSEGGLTFYATPITGQKTGWFYDQRDNRAHVAAFCAGKRVIDLYTHTGGFALYALKAGAESALGIDASADALKLAAQSADMQDVAERANWHKADVFDYLPELIRAGERFDVVIADPPAFVKTRKDHGAGLKGYAKLARMCAQITGKNGLLVFASCSHHVSVQELVGAIADGLTAAGRTGRILRIGFAGADHPLHPHLPESAYLKCLTIALD